MTSNKSQSTRATSIYRLIDAQLLARVVLAGVLSLIIVKWIGDVTVYMPADAAKRADYHQAILDNQPVEGKSWMEMGAEGLNVRVLTVYVAEQLHVKFDKDLEFIYRLIDLVCVFALLLIVHAYLRHWFDELGATTGMLLLGALLPLSMFQHLFHPWDKPSILLWATMGLMLCKGWLAGFCIAYALSVVVKFDALTAAAMIWFAGVSRQTLVRPTVVSGAVLAMGLVIFEILLTYLPGGVGPRDVMDQLQRNYLQFRALGIAYPPLLVHGMLGVFGLLAWRSGDLLARRLWLCGLAVLLPHLLFTNFAEVRAQFGTVICMLPLALCALGLRPRHRHALQIL